MNMEEPEQNSPVLKMTGIKKSFLGVRALNQVDFTLRRGEIHAIMGENGAGKSTLIKVLTGVYSMDEGSVSIMGKQVRINSPQSAQRHGISTVYQEVNLCPNLTVGENIFLGSSRVPQVLSTGVKCTTMLPNYCKNSTFQYLQLYSWIPVQ